MDTIKFYGWFSASNSWCYYREHNCMQRTSWSKLYYFSCNRRHFLYLEHSCGASITSGQGSSGITVTFGINSGNICVVANNSCSISAPSFLSVTTTNSTPNAAGIITGTSTVCQGQSGVAYSISAVSNTTSYVWSYTGTGFSIATGAGTNSITANFSALATPGTLSVYGTNACGNGAASSGYSVTLNPILTASISISANPSGAICSGTSVTFTATPTNGGTTPAYQWKLNGGIVGTNSAIYTSTTLAKNDTVTCVMTSNATCAIPPVVTSNAIKMTVSVCVKVLVVAGGGGGGSSYGGGGGAGGYKYNASYPLSTGSYSVTVGDGGAGGADSPSLTNGSNGGNSIFDAITSHGGGGGGSQFQNGANGGSGSGSGYYTPGGQNTSVGIGIPGEGNDGGMGYHNPGVWAAGGGGGGSAQAGTNAVLATQTSGSGGNGTSNSISGIPTYYAGGGGGGWHGNAGGNSGIGGLGGGGNGTFATDPSSHPGTSNTGGGGGGGTGIGGAGGSGIVIISYPIGSSTATGGTITTSVGYTIHTFTGSGTFTVVSHTLITIDSPTF